MTERKIDKIFGELLKQYYRPIYRYCFYCLKYDKQLCEECTQDVFMALYECLDNLRDLTNIRAWIYRTADNYVHRYVRQTANRGKKILFLDNEGLENAVRTPDNQIEALLDRQIDELKFIGQILEELSEENLQLYQLYFKEKKSIKEIAAILNISETAVTTRIYRLKIKIKEIAHRILESALYI